MSSMLGGSKVALVYARALFNAVKEGSDLEKVGVDIKDLLILLNDNNSALYRMLSSPIMDIKEKKDLMSKVFPSNMDSILINFLELLMSKSRFDQVKGVLDMYSMMLDEHNGVVRGEVKISNMPNSDEKGKIVDSMKVLINKKIEADFIEDQELVAGFSANIGSYRFEYSFDSHLKQIEKKLIRG